MKNLEFVALSVVLVICASAAQATTWQVGPTRTYKTVMSAYNAAASGDTIEIDSGTYYQSQGWVYINGKNNLTFRGVGATRPVIDAGNSLYKSKGIFVIELGTLNTTIENLELANARMNIGASGNAACIRAQGTGLTLRNCYLHDSDDGVLNGGGTMLFEYCEFYHNGEGDGQSHNIYVNGTGTFTMRYCWSHNANVGHAVKTRMGTNYILYNLISDDGGPESYEIDIPDSGTSYVIGNCIYQTGGYNPGNKMMIAYAEESSNNPDQHLYLVNNTIVTTVGGTFAWNASSTSALLQNNILQGGAGLSGGFTQTSNWSTGNAYLVNPAGYDFHPTTSSTGALDLGTTPGSGINGFNMTPVSQYVHPCGAQARPTYGPLDMGAYELLGPNRSPTVDAGANQSVYEGALVHLHATASDPDLDPLTYAWPQTTGLNVSLAGGSTADVSFTVPQISTLAQASMTFSVTVSDGKGGQASDSVNVRVYMMGDVNRNDSVNVGDLQMLVAAWGSDNSGAWGNWNANADLNSDGFVNVSDLQLLVANWARQLN